MGLTHGERQEATRVVLLCLVWYTLSSVNNVVGKTLLTYFPYPMTLSMVQLLSIALYSDPVLRCLSVRTAGHISWSYYTWRVLPLALGKFIAVLFAHISIWKVPLSYAHTVKATMPLFTVVLGRLLIGQRQTTAVMTETGVHHMRLLHILGKLSFLMFVPIWLVFDLRRFVVVGNVLPAPGDGAEGWMYTLMLLSLDGLLSFAQNVVAFTMLHLVSPLTYSVCNATKRISVIVVSLMFMRNPVTPTNVLGMMMAVGGVFLYNRAKYEANQLRRVAAQLPVAQPGNALLRSAGAGIDWADKLSPVYLGGAGAATVVDLCADGPHHVSGLHHTAGAHYAAAPHQANGRLYSDQQYNDEHYSKGHPSRAHATILMTA